MLRFALCFALVSRVAADASPADAGGLVLATPPTPPGFDPYSVLGVTASATEPELRAAARRARKAAKAERASLLASGVSETELDEATGLIDIAYDILADAAQKQKWDLEHPRLDFKKLEAEEEAEEAAAARRGGAAGRAADL